MNLLKPDEYFENIGRKIEQGAHDISEKAGEFCY